MKKKTYSKNEAVGFEEFYALAEFFNSTLNGDLVAAPMQTAKAKILLKADEYLQKGEKLISLAKENFKKIVNKSEISNFEKILYDIELKGDLINTIAIKVIRPILRQSQIVDGKLSDTALAELLSFLSFNVEIIPILQLGTCPYAASFRKQLQNDSMLKVIIHESGYDDVIIYGLKCHTHASSKSNMLFKCGDCVADIARVLAHLTLLSIFIKVANLPDSDSYKDTLQYYRKKERLTKMDVGCSLSALRYRTKDARLSAAHSISEEEYFDQCSDIWKHPWLLPEESDIIYDSLKPLFDEHNTKVERVHMPYKKCHAERRKRLENGKYRVPSEVPIIIDPTIVHALLWYDPFGFMSTVPDALTYHSFLTKGTTGYWAIPAYSRFLNELIENVFEYEYHYKHMKVTALNELKRLDSDYAKSYQTKKNIPAKTLTSMEESIFNEYFGYVEFDQDVDLNKIAVVAEQFVAFKETYLPDIISSDNAIRFRRLGNHKALGLYYPSVKCLCVDINSPASLIHEYAHLIDFCYGSLSSESEFYTVKRMYEERLRKKMNDDAGFRSRMIGKGKYNLSYYLIPTEIFARTFELYVKEVLKVNNSLTPSTYEAVYPTDAEFLSAVSEYFKDILPALGDKKRQTAA